MYLGNRLALVAACAVLLGLQAGCKTTTTRRSGVSGIQTPPMFGENDKAKPATGAVVPAGYRSATTPADPKADCTH